MITSNMFILLQQEVVQFWTIYVNFWKKEKIVRTDPIAQTRAYMRGFSHLFILPRWVNSGFYMEYPATQVHPDQRAGSCKQLQVFD